MRTAGFLYVEYATGEKEYHALASDPDELSNSYASLPAKTKADLQATLSKLQTCRGANQCLAVGQPTKDAAHQ
jgi:hypothetical protein